MRELLGLPLGYSGTPIIGTRAVHDDEVGLIILVTPEDEKDGVLNPTTTSALLFNTSARSVNGIAYTYILVMMIDWCFLEKLEIECACQREKIRSLMFEHSLYTLLSAVELVIDKVESQIVSWDYHNE
jgi:hypothetical protein